MRSESIVNAVIKSKKFWGYALLISVLLILVLLLRGEVLSQNWEQQLVQSLIGGTVAAIFLSVLIHLGLVLDTKEIHERTRKTIKDRLDHQRNEIISKVEDKSHDIVNRVGEKFEARYKWGLHSVIETITEGNELDDVENSEVMWLNTKFEDAELQAKVIRSAVERGCHVRLLLMHVDSKMMNYRGAYTAEHHQDEQKIENQTRIYKIGAQKSAIEMVRLYHDLAKKYPIKQRQSAAKTDQKVKRVEQGFDLRFYEDTPAVPMLLWQGEYIKRGFTGFYLNSFSRMMPYLEWHGEDGKMLDHLYEYFEKKWYFAREWDAEKLDLDSLLDAAAILPARSE